MFNCISFHDQKEIKRLKITQNADWPDVTPEQMAALWSKLAVVIAQEVGIDADGDCPVALNLSNRTRESCTDYFPIDHHPDQIHRGFSKATADEVDHWETDTLQNLTINLDMAAEALRVFSKRYLWRRQDKERKK